MFRRMLKVLKFMFFRRMLYCLRSMHAFFCAPSVLCLSGVIVSFVKKCRVVKVHFMIKSPCMFCKIGTINKLQADFVTSTCDNISKNMVLIP